MHVLLVTPTRGSKSRNSEGNLNDVMNLQTEKRQGEERAMIGYVLLKISILKISSHIGPTLQQLAAAG